MSALVYLKNDSSTSFVLPINKLFRVQLNPGDLVTYPVNQMVKDFTKFLDRCTHEVEGEIVPAIRHGYYDSSKQTYEDIVALLNGEEVEIEDEQEFDFLATIDSKNIVTLDQMEAQDTWVLKRADLKLGNEGSYHRAATIESIQATMDQWSSLPIEERAVLTDEEVDILEGK